MWVMSIEIGEDENHDSTYRCSRTAPFYAHLTPETPDQGM
jgi:hypothetical protein